MKSIAIKSPNRASHAGASLLLQRRCACGQGAAALTRTCKDCERGPLLGLQARLLVGAVNDPLEDEADRAAAQVLAPSSSNHAKVHGHQPPMLSRAATHTMNTGTEAPASVHQTLSTLGEPLSATLRRRFEPRFGHDFSRVRVHRDAPARQSARDVHAAAYTVGQSIVFGQGQYAPDTTTGRALLAHELAHVVQQGAAAPAVLRRRGFFEQLAGLFAGDDFDDETLATYLEQLRRTQRIEDFTDSDNKARAVVNEWKDGDSPHVLTEDVKALLIREMLSGVTGDDDEKAILELLERAYNYELTYIFSAGGVTLDALNGALHGQEQDCLDAFVARRFAGGAAALAAGRIQPTGSAIAFGQAVSSRCALALDSLAILGVEWSLPCVLGILCSEDSEVVDALQRFDVRSVSSIDVDHWKYDGSTWSVTKTGHPVGAANAHASPPEIYLLRDRSCDSAVRTIVHEVRHQTQPLGSRLSNETDAYTYTEQWSIDRGLPGNRRLRTIDSEGRQAVDPVAVDAYVRQRYPGTDSASETIVGHRDADGHAEISPVSGGNFFRPPQAQDSHWSAPRFNAPQVLRAEKWKCPSTRQSLQLALQSSVVPTHFNDRIADSVWDL